MRRREGMSRILFICAAGALAAAFLAAPASSDWIKTREGALVETRGHWTVKGQIVVFTAANGTLSSLRLSEVDLDASAVATFESKKEAEERANTRAPEAAREPVLVLTNENIPRAGAAAFADEGEGGEEASAAAPREEPVTVISWRPVENEETGGLEVRGAVQNQGEHIASNLRLLVRLYDNGGELLGTSNAFLDQLSVAPTSSVKFRALFPDVNESSVTPEFEVHSSAIQLEVVETDTAEGDES